MKSVLTKFMRRLRFAISAFKYYDRAIYGIPISQEYCGVLPPSQVESIIYAIKMTYIDKDGQEKQRHLSLT